MTTSKMDKLLAALKSHGWIAVSAIELRRGDQVIIFDTSRWMELYTLGSKRIFDVPDTDLTVWTANLIDVLFDLSEKAQTPGGQTTR
ncbi:hypothetical protein [Actibacterium sp. 188UL27-1]|uniref:hypothetical protein n=1 Tax=Actibacterium sp. 188UL27-1 TaxID=2786961 RepID=UPI001957AE87|nr:hypothetical protein [Actibacterium sp. 188UL27-1]MBM7066810.1 hypothetical protein [Actibacterium sp. 188UL27-1]